MVYDKQRQNAIGSRIGVCVFIFQNKMAGAGAGGAGGAGGQTFHFQFHLVGVLI
jgi:hypothetical protein